jgi:enolase-phosphatase E1
MIKAIVTDIEGTTTSLSFVRDVLFPYTKTHLADFVRLHQADKEVEALLEQVRLGMKTDMSVEQIIDQLLVWIDADEKITVLKSLQGIIWEAGYRQGHFTGHVYDDAAEQLKTWEQKGYSLYIYSSGSVFAQKLLFSHTPHGDLTPLFSGFFDTHIGGKKEVLSYRHIATQIGCSPHEILFLSDVKEELDAARIAGFETYWLVREQPIDFQAVHRQIGDFNAIRL